LRGRSSDVGATQFRVAKTTTNADYPSYPTSGDTFVVELGELSWTEATGTQANTWTAYSPQDTRIAHDITGKYWAQNSYVYVALHHGRWHILGGANAVVAARVTNIGSLATANTVRCETGTLTFTEAVGRPTLSFTADSPQALIYAKEINGNGPPPRVGDVVLVSSVNSRWYIIKTTAKARLKASVLSSAGITAGSSGLVAVWENGVQTSRQETAYANWMANSAIAQNKKVIIEWYEDEAKWVIVSSEC
jgi:hypothetical protein